MGELADAWPSLGLHRMGTGVDKLLTMAYLRVQMDKAEKSGHTAFLYEDRGRLKANLADEGMHRTDCSNMPVCARILALLVCCLA